eukprot:277099-Amphidinium_carterae.2
MSSKILMKIDSSGIEVFATDQAVQPRHKTSPTQPSTRITKRTDACNQTGSIISWGRNFSFIDSWGVVFWGLSSQESFRR